MVDPVSALRSYVRAVSYSPPSDVPTTRDLVLPDARSVSIWINLHQDEFATYRTLTEERRTTGGAIAAGPTDHAAIIEIEAGRSHVCIDFAPGAAHAVLGDQLIELRNEMVDLHEVRKDTATWREQILDAPSPAAMLALVCDELMSRVRDVDVDLAAVELARLLDLGTSVSAAADQIGLTTRTLLRRFTRAFGVTPKRYARVQRLNQLARSIAGTPVVDWASEAAAHGYADQAHLIDDFRDLVGVTPSAYLAARGAGPTHVTLEAAP